MRETFLGGPALLMPGTGATVRPPEPSAEAFASASHKARSDAECRDAVRNIDNRFGQIVRNYNIRSDGGAADLAEVMQKSPEFVQRLGKAVEATLEDIALIRKDCGDYFKSAEGAEWARRLGEVEEKLVALQRGLRQRPHLNFEELGKKAFAALEGLADFAGWAIGGLGGAAGALWNWLRGSPAHGY